MDFDFDDLIPTTEPVWFTLIDPKTGDDAMRNGEPIKVSILGPDSPAMRAFEAATQNRRAARAGRNLSKLTEALDAETLDKEATDRAAHALVGWRNFARAGVEIPYTPATARELVEVSRPLRDFVIGRYSDQGNFLGIEVPTPKK